MIAKYITFNEASRSYAIANAADIIINMMPPDISFEEICKSGYLYAPYISLQISNSIRRKDDY